MNSVEEAVQYYRERKANSELSILEIRKELENTGNFNAAEVSRICRTISDSELDGLQTESSNPLDFLNSIYFSIGLIPVFAYLTYVAYIGLEDLWARQAIGEVPMNIVTWRYFIMAGALFFLIRNILRAVVYFKNK